MFVDYVNIVNDVTRESTKFKLKKIQGEHLIERKVKKYFVYRY